MVPKLHSVPSPSLTGTGEKEAKLRQLCGMVRSTPERKPRDFLLSPLPVALLAFILEIGCDFSENRIRSLTLCS